MFETDDRTERILLVEDEPGLADLYAEWLNESYKVEVAHDCATAYSLFEEPIDVALLDRRLPDGSGDEILAEIRDLGLDWRVAMITAEKPSSDVVTMEFDEYLYKPVTRKKLYSTVNQLIIREKIKKVAIEYNRFSTKKTLIDTYCSSDECVTSDEYARLENRLKELQEKLTEYTDSDPELSFHPDKEDIYSD